MKREILGPKFQGCPEFGVAGFQETNNNLLLTRCIKQTLKEIDHNVFVYDIYSLHQYVMCITFYSSTVIYKNIMES